MTWQQQLIDKFSQWRCSFASIKRFVLIASGFLALWTLYFLYLNIAQYARVEFIGHDAIYWILPALGPHLGLGLPFKDIWDEKSPGLYYLIKFWSLIFGDTNFSFKLMHIVTLLGGMLLFGLILKKIASKKVAFFCYLAAAVFYFSPFLNNNFLSCEQLGTVVSLSGLLFLMLSIEKGKRIFTFLAAFFLFYAGFVKDPYFLLVPALLPLFIKSIAILKKIGGTVLANACGPCIGQWKREDIEMGEANSIVTSFNRNFPGRNDGNAKTLAFIASPEMVTVFALAGRIDFNPINDFILTPNGKKIKLVAPESNELPSKGFAGGQKGFMPPLPQMKRKKIQVVIDARSDRLQKLKPFEPWDGKGFENLYVLIKAKGKCTTDHISPAGAWLRFRGHLDKISDNLLLGARNEFTPEPGKAKNWLQDGKTMTPAEAARDYQQNGYGWVIVGDENYGEGSSREHAAMSPRFLGCKAVIAKSFARIHETNLKKQGLLPLAFKHPGDYDKIKEETRVSIKGLTKFAPGGTLTLILRQRDESTEEVELIHSFTDEQIRWFKAGSALNLMRSRQ